MVRIPLANVMHVRSTDVIEVTAIVIANVRKVYMANESGVQLLAKVPMTRHVFSA